MKFSPLHADTMFWPKVSKAAHPKGCWLYYRTDPRGYGRYLKAGPYAYAHRTAWIITNGPIPEGMEVAHRCDTRNCCNPEHLFLATHEENMADCKAKGRQTYGTKNKSAKITEEQAQEILRRRLTKKKLRGNAAFVKSLAERYGVRVGVVYAIWRGDAWAHLSHSGDGERS